MPTENNNPIQRFTDLWLENQDMLAGYVYMRIRNFHDAEDVIQEIARSAAGTFDQYDPAKPFGPWLIAIANRRVVDYWRKKGRSPLTLTDQALQDIADAHLELTQSRDDRFDALQACLSKLSDRHHHAIDLRYGQALAPEQIAKRVGASTTAVNALIYRVRKALASCIEERLGRGA
ncbi:MAG: sigma-70 family RNA polymerase sigma factor [Phycisphaeraceae bacterium]|nr:sigma-70 family RNA polymerase sigma factor [Phycisphaeraceae bacterium]